MLSKALRSSSVKPSITYNATASDSTDLTTYTFTSISIGTAATNRMVYVAITFLALGARSISSATIGGVSASIIDPAGQGNGTKIIYANIPTGTTATIVITFDTSCTSCVIGTYSLYNLKYQVPISSAFTNGWTSNSISASVSAPQDAIIIAGVNNSANTNAITWTVGATSRYSTIVDGSRSSGASSQVTTGSTSYTVTATSTTATTGRLSVFVWR